MKFDGFTRFCCFVPQSMDPVFFSGPDAFRIEAKTQGSTREIPSATMAWSAPCGTAERFYHLTAAHEQ